MLKLPWPEIHSSHRPDDTIREILDYLVWIAGAMSEVGLHGGSDATLWRGKIQTAYRVLFLPPMAGHGDPYPPDVPPALHPGAWPDIPAGSLPGMTIRHQLKVIGLLGLSLRDTIWAHGREPQFHEWDRRLCLAREALDQAETIPDDARTAMSDAALAEAKAQEAAKKAHAKSRELRLRRLKDQTRRRKTQPKVAPTAKPAPKKKAAEAKKAAPKKAAPKKKASPKKKPVAKKKATPAKKAAPKRKAAPTKKAVAKKKPPAKKKGSR